MNKKEYQQCLEFERIVLYNLQNIRYSLYLFYFILVSIIPPFVLSFNSVSDAEMNKLIIFGIAIVIYLFVGLNILEDKLNKIFEER